MSNQAFFAGLIVDEWDNPLAVAYVGGEACYVVDDRGFHRHVDAEALDRQVLELFVEQLHEHQDIAVAQALNMLGQDDLFTKAAIDASIRNVKVDEILRQGIPQQAREMLGMMGFRVVVDWRGDLLRFDQPSIAVDEDE